jgi:NADPH2:quinone reductase
VVAPQQYCVPLPPSIDPQIATAIFVQGSTAHLLVHQVAKGLKGKTVLIHAATGGVGSLLVQLAKMEGARVIAASSSDEKLLKAKELGADMVINYSRPNWVKQLVELNEGAKVDYIFEMVGGKIYEQSFSALKTGGTMVVYGAASGEKGLVHSEHFVDESHQLLSFNLAHFIQVSPGEWQASLGAVIGLLAQGQLKVDTSAVYPLHRASDAHKDLEGRKTTGKVVLVP